MRIALFSFEYPPDTGFGGIATTTRQLASMMHQRGNQVEVFAGSSIRTHSQLEEDGFWVHRQFAKRRADFIGAVVPIFQQRHQLNPFDVIESPEFGADAAAVLQVAPDIPLAVRLHTPSVMVAEHDGMSSLPAQLQIRLGKLRRGISPFGDLEHRLALTADELIAPSWAIGKALIQRWQLDSQRVHAIPNPFTPTPALLDVPVGNLASTVTFIGRLDIKKGVTDLATAIPTVLEACPQAKFRFVGRNGQSPIPTVDMQQFLTQQLAPHLSSVEFIGPVSQAELPSVLANSAVCVFPSRWENFPNVCLEAMAAGRAIVGSNAGGMAEMLVSEQFGRLVPPQQPQAIAHAILELLKNPELRQQLGRKARQKVLNEYSADRICQLQEASYERAIAVRQKNNPRPRRLLL